jgi:hypothetical protein
LFVKAYREFSVRPKISVVPFIKFGYDMISTTLKNDYGDKVKDDDNARSFACGIPLVYTNDMGNKVILLPELAYARKNTSFSIGLGFVFAGEKY